MLSKWGRPSVMYMGYSEEHLVSNPIAYRLRSSRKEGGHPRRSLCFQSCSLCACVFRNLVAPKQPQFCLYIIAKEVICQFFVIFCLMGVFVLPALLESWAQADGRFSVKRVTTHPCPLWASPELSQQHLTLMTPPGVSHRERQLPIGRGGKLSMVSYIWPWHGAPRYVILYKEQ